MEQTQDIRLAVDAVVFGYHAEEGLQVLLIKRNIEPYQDVWALPGGLVKNSESLEQAIERELQEETGVAINYLEQLYSFGAPARDPRNRVVSIAYYGLVKPEVFDLRPGTDANAAQWYDTHALPDLAFDHQEIIHYALKRLKGKIVYEPIGFELLDELFPFSALEKLYSVVLGQPVDRRNFKKKIMKFGFLEETDQKQKLKGAGRPGPLFKFNKEKYFQLKKEGINFEL
ncbi:MAG TPA: NUDIX hydrolase [Cytophagales bacterium]|nr:NUDIX hydrolase [Cytophagales bacterium]HAA24352.1 NUDIX hydrolase [Cytophagales bacterium]HAP61018.1 NUDIX hydrolase [Cytophagales bacterium]